MAASALLKRILESGFSPSDDQELRLKKIALTLVPLIIGSATFLWGLIYFYFERPLSGSIPMFYALISAVSLLHFFRTKKLMFLQYSQLLLVLFLPFLLMWSLGGFAAGSLVMIWAIFTPVAGIMFYDKRTAFGWFLAYFALIVVSALFDHPLSAAIPPLPQSAQTVFFLLNVGCTSAGLYFLVSYAVNVEKLAIKRLCEEQVLLKRLHIDLEREKQNAITASKTKTTFLANMSHELRTPLNAIIGFSDTIKGEVFGPLGNAKYVEYIGDIHHSGQHLLDLINDILDASAIEAGAMRLHEETINLADVIGESIRLITPRANEGKVQLVLNIEPELPLICADQRRTKQVMLNLLSNAVKFTPLGGSVSVSAVLNEDGSASIVVADTGVGMDAQEIQKAMTMFGQIDSELTHEGTGLGLPLTKGLMELHGGTLRISSRKNSGTQMTVTFPKERVNRLACS